MHAVLTKPVFLQALVTVVKDFCISSVITPFKKMYRHFLLQSKKTHFNTEIL